MNVIKPGTEEWRVWEIYFNVFLGFEPTIMTQVRADRFKSMTVPCQWPEWFDDSYAKRDDGVSHVANRPAEQPFHPYIAQHRANVFVPADNESYPQMVDRSRNADDREFRYEQQRPGIWVSRNWIDNDVPRQTKSKQFGASDLQAIYDRNNAA